MALTEGAKWDLPINKTLHAHYAQNAIQIEAGELDAVCVLAKQLQLALYLGIIERAQDREGTACIVPWCTSIKAGEFSRYIESCNPPMMNDSLGHPAMVTVYKYIL